MDILVHNMFIPKKAPVHVDIYPKTRIHIESVKLSGNSSSSLNFHYSTINESSSNTHCADQIEDFYCPIYFTSSVEVYHPIQVRKANETHILTIVYRTLDNQTSGFAQPLVLKEDFRWRVESWDLGNFNYFWIIFSGVLLSRVFPFFQIKTKKDKTMQVRRMVVLPALT